VCVLHANTLVRGADVSVSEHDLRFRSWEKATPTWFHHGLFVVPLSDLFSSGIPNPKWKRGRFYLSCRLSLVVCRTLRRLRRKFDCLVPVFFCSPFLSRRRHSPVLMSVNHPHTHTHTHIHYNVEIGSPYIVDDITRKEGDVVRQELSWVVTLNEKLAHGPPLFSLSISLLMTNQKKVYPSSLSYPPFLSFSLSSVRKYLCVTPKRGGDRHVRG